MVVEISTDENGIPDTSSMRVVATTHDLFAASVRQALAKWHLSPRANVRLPFLFVMSNKSATDLSSVPAGTVVITGVPASNPGVHVAAAVVSTALPSEQRDTARTVFREIPARVALRERDSTRAVVRDTEPIYRDRWRCAAPRGPRSRGETVRGTTCPTLSSRFTLEGRR